MASQSTHYLINLWLGGNGQIMAMIVSLYLFNIIIKVMEFLMDWFCIGNGNILIFNYQRILIVSYSINLMEGKKKAATKKIMPVMKTNTVKV